MTVTFQSAHDKARMMDPAIRRVRAKVVLVPDERFERLLPQRVAIIEITLADGTRLEKRINAVRGTAQNPMTRSEIIAKATDLIAPILGAETCSDLIEKTFRLEEVKDIRDLRSLLLRA